MWENTIRFKVLTFKGYVLQFFDWVGRSGPLSTWDGKFAFRAFSPVLTPCKYVSCMFHAFSLFTDPVVVAKGRSGRGWPHGGSKCRMQATRGTFHLQVGSVASLPPFEALLIPPLNMRHSSISGPVPANSGNPCPCLCLRVALEHTAAVSTCTAPIPHACVPDVAGYLRGPPHLACALSTG